MTRATRGLAILTAVLALSLAALAQSGGGQSAAADPISGVWTGSVGPGATPGYSITMKLAYDGRAAISGTAQGAEPGDTAVVKTGTFDPQTGALKLELAIRDGSQTATFEGTVVLDTAAGKLTLSNQPGPGTFLLKRGTGASAPAATPATSAALKSGFDELSGWILKSAEMVPAEKYTYQPVKTVRTFGQLIAHIVDGQSYYCAGASGRKVEWTDTTEKGRTDKATLLPKLKQSMDACAAAYGGTLTPPLFANLSHSSLHYGNVVTYLRMLGLTPPSS